MNTLTLEKCTIRIVLFLVHFQLTINDLEQFVADCKILHSKQQIVARVFLQCSTLAHLGVTPGQEVLKETLGAIVDHTVAVLTCTRLEKLDFLQPFAKMQWDPASIVVKLLSSYVRLPSFHSFYQESLYLFTNYAMTAFVVTVFHKPIKYYMGASDQALVLCTYFLLLKLFSMLVNSYYCIHKLSV